MDIYNYLLNNVWLKVGNERCRIVEIEQYSHPDPYIHCTSEQFTSYRWYFHKSGSNYRNGNYKGLDLTFGTETHCGGILLRSIETNGVLIEGPSKLVDFILSTTGHSSISSLVAVSPFYPPSASSDNIFPLYLESGFLEPRKIFAGPRVGLSTKYPEYLMKPLRFTTVPSQLKKYKSLLVLHNYLVNPNIVDEWKIRNSDFQKWLRAYNDNTINNVSVKTVSDQCQTYRYCRDRQYI